MAFYIITRRFSPNFVKHAFKKLSTNPQTTFTVEELKDKLSKTMLGAETGYTPIPPNRNHLLKYLPKEQRELPPRSLRDSYVEGYIPLLKNMKMRDSYTTFLGTLRIGRILEDMDYFAVMVAQKHIVLPNLPPNVPLPHTLVTARIDQIDFTSFVPDVKEDVKISGHINWVGKSSMEIVVWMGQKRHGTWNRITKAVFFIAARDPTHKHSAVVNPLVPKDDKERKIIELAETRGRLKRQKDASHVSKIRPNDEEQKILHDLYLKTVAYKQVKTSATIPTAGSVWMENLTLSNNIFSQPENRNLHNTVFGGFIMRQATQLSWLLGMRFSKYRPHLKSISDIEFKHPILVNSVIRMNAWVVFTYMEYIQITVFVETWVTQEDVSTQTNVLHFTYQVPEFVKEVYPKTYNEAMMYIDGRRHFDEVMKPMIEEEGLLNEEGSLVG